MQGARDDIAIRISGLKKRYRLGQIGGGTLQGDLKEWYERRRSGDAPRDIGSDGPNKTFYALKGIDLTVRKGETLGIIGRNGAGKSTMLKVLSRITSPTEGEVDIYGRVASMLEVGTGFDGQMTGRENVYLNGAILGMTRAEIDRKMDDIISFAEMEEFIDTPVKRYSSGMYVKLGFAVAAHLDSEIMIMDEVLAVGDMEFQHKCLDKMRAAAKEQGKTVLYVSHNMNTIKRLCERCIVMDEGRIVYDGNVDGAVALYLGGGKLLRSSFEYDDGYRPYDAQLRKNKRLNMDSLRVLDVDEPLYASDGLARMELACTALRPLARVGFRFEFWAQDGTKVGTMLSGGFVDLETGENRIVFDMHLDHLASGQYNADLVAYLHDSDGNEDILDGVYPGVIVEVRDVLGENTHLDWHHQYWGHVHLHDLGVQKAEAGA